MVLGGSKKELEEKKAERKERKEEFAKIK